MGRAKAGGRSPVLLVLLLLLATPWPGARAAAADTPSATDPPQASSELIAEVRARRRSDVQIDIPKASAYRCSSSDPTSTPVAHTRIKTPQVQDEIHKDKALLSTVSEELDRLQSLWKRVSMDKGGTYRNRQRLQSEINEVNEGSTRSHRTRSTA